MIDNCSTARTDELATGKDNAKWLLKAAAISILVVALAFSILPRHGKVRYGRTLYKSYQSHNEIADAILAFEAEHGHLPPPFVADDNGNRLHSWRVLILPYLGHKKLYDEYRFDEAWNGPNNTQLASEMPDVFRSFAGSDLASGDRTSYLAITGGDTVWRLDALSTSKQIKDDHRITALLLEFVDRPVQWMAPEDVRFDAMFDQNGNAVIKPKSTEEGDSVVVSYVDGYTEVLKDIPSFALRALLTAGGGERIDTNSLLRP